MLPKVSAALSKFIAPVASSTSEQARRDSTRKNPGQRRSFRVIKGGADPAESGGVTDPASSVPATGSTNPDAGGGGFQKFQPPELRASQTVQPSATESDQPAPADNPAASASGPLAKAPPNLTPGQVLLQIMASLDLKHGFSRLLGAIAYRTAIRSQKASGRIRKGAVLDQKVE